MDQLNCRGQRLIELWLAAAAIIGLFLVGRGMAQARPSDRADSRVNSSTVRAHHSSSRPDRQQNDQVLEIPQVVAPATVPDQNVGADKKQQSDGSAQASAEPSAPAPDAAPGSLADRVGDLHDYEEQGAGPPVIFYAPGASPYMPGIAASGLTSITGSRLIRPPILQSPIIHAPLMRGEMTAARPIILPPTSAGALPSTSPMLMPPRGALIGPPGVMPSGGWRR